VTTGCSTTAILFFFSAHRLSWFEYAKLARKRLGFDIMGLNVAAAPASLSVSRAA